MISVAESHGNYCSSSTENGKNLAETLTDRTDRRRSDGGSISQFLLTTLVNLLVTISATVHATIFVSPFIEASMAYYQAEGTRLIGEIGSGENTSMTYPKYLNHVKKRLVEEGERCDVVIGTGVKDAALDVVEKSLIGAHVPSLLENGLPLLLREVRIDDLKTMYTLLDKVSALDKLKAAFGGYVKVWQRISSEVHICLTL